MLNLHSIHKRDNLTIVISKSGPYMFHYHHNHSPYLKRFKHFLYPKLLTTNVWLMINLVEPCLMDCRQGKIIGLRHEGVHLHILELLKYTYILIFFALYTHYLFLHSKLKGSKQFQYTHFQIANFSLHFFVLY